MKAIIEKLLALPKSIIAKVLGILGAVAGKLPFVGRIPKRTLLILVGCLAVVLIAIPLMLSFGKSGGADAKSEEPVSQSSAITNKATATPATATTPTPTSTPEPKATPESTPTPTPSPTPAVPTATSPDVGGVIAEDTVWTTEFSPYRVQETVRIPSGITLTIEPGVTITASQVGTMFSLKGTLTAHGTAEKPIVFDGGGIADFFNAGNSDANTLLDLDQCEIRNGLSFWPNSHQPQRGIFSLRHSRLTDISGLSYIAYPAGDITIEYNTFTNTAGFSIGHTGTVKVMIQYNTFKGKSSGLPANADFWIQNWGSFGQSQTVVRYNSFRPADRIALKILGDSAAMIATENYWGTEDKNVINGMIYDKADDSACAGYIAFEPLLSQPHADTPTALQK
ncbi:MAG: hypothetical protein PHV74_02510 [Dehalococcoidia bacterium]|nr:hypothetical protein [Dehalococcoidia bacterium]